MYSWPFYLDAAEEGGGQEWKLQLQELGRWNKVTLLLLFFFFYGTVSSAASCVFHQTSTHQVVFCASLCVRICLRLSSHSIRYLQTVLWSISGFTTDRCHSNEMSLFFCHFNFVYTSRGGGGRPLNIWMFGPKESCRRLGVITQHKADQWQGTFMMFDFPHSRVREKRWGRRDETTEDHHNKHQHLYVFCICCSTVKKGGVC